MMSELFEKLLKKVKFDSNYNYFDGKNESNEIENADKTMENQINRSSNFPGNKCRSISEIPEIFRHIFSQYPHFNEVQSTVIDDVFYTDKPLVVSAPTGSGKTAIFELSILRLLMNMDQSSLCFKIIYLAPMKALCHERFLDWDRKFSQHGVNCLEVTGDSDVTELLSIEAYKLIIATPEKWDALTRKWRDTQSFVENIKLILIDEVHFLNENERGASLEAVISRMKTLGPVLNDQQTSFSTTNKFGIRFVAISATIPNIEDIAYWIGGAQSVLYKLTEETRPIKLKKYVFGFPSSQFGSYFRFDMSLNYKIGAIIKKYSDGKPTIVFCSTRKGVEIAADVLFNASFFNNNETIYNGNGFLSRIKDIKLKKILSSGIAYHHGGLITEDRTAVEDNFKMGKIKVIFCTSTLAMGINLPAHLVIIKSTQYYKKSVILEYSDSTIFQMIGRAGRPQFDDSGVVVIMTQENKVNKYESMIGGTTLIESHLHKHLAEHLNAEIALQTITDLPIAMKWVRSTYLYVRAIKNPTNYGFNPMLNKENVEKKLEEMCIEEITNLERADLITKDQTYGIEISSTIYGKLMAKYYLNFKTMQHFGNINGSESLSELLQILSKCHEFADFNLRVGDKSPLNELNSSKSNNLIRYPIKGKIKTTEQKVYCLLQILLGNITLMNSSLYQESINILKLAGKLSKALADYIYESSIKLGTKRFRALFHSTILIKCYQTRLWENSPFVSRQLSKIGPTYSKLLADAGKISFNALMETSPREIEMILKKAPPFGNQVIDSISKLPKYTIRIIILNSNYGRITVHQINTTYILEHNTTQSFKNKLSVIVGDSSNNLLLFKENISNILGHCKVYEKQFKIIDPTATNLIGHIIHQSLVGADATINLPLCTSDEFQNISSKTLIQPNETKPQKKKSKVIKKNIQNTRTSGVEQARIKPNPANDFGLGKTIDFNSKEQRTSKDQAETLSVAKYDIIEILEPKSINLKEKSSYDEPFSNAKLDIIDILEPTPKHLKKEPVLYDNDQKIQNLNKQNHINVNTNALLNSASASVKVKHLDIGDEPFLFEISTFSEPSLKLQDTGLFPSTPSVEVISKRLHKSRSHKIIQNICDKNCFSAKNQEKFETVKRKQMFKRKQNLKNEIILSSDEDEEPRTTIKNDFFEIEDKTCSKESAMKTNNTGDMVPLAIVKKPKTVSFDLKEFSYENRKETRGSIRPCATLNDTNKHDEIFCNEVSENTSYIKQWFDEDSSISKYPEVTSSSIPRKQSFGLFDQSTSKRTENTTFEQKLKSLRGRDLFRSNSFKHKRFSTMKFSRELTRNPLQTNQQRFYNNHSQSNYLPKYPLQHCEKNIHLNKTFNNY